jgi:hypothetical protein
MNLDFLDVLSLPIQKTAGTLGTAGTASIDAGLPGSHAVLPVGNLGNQMPGSVAGDDDGSHQFPSGSPVPAAEKPCIYAAVPNVPTVPIENKQVCGAKEVTGPEMARQVGRWLAARCTRSRRGWGAEKFLYRDFRDWCQQSGQTAIPREHFAGILNESFERDMDGWQGLCLAVDFAASNGFGSKPISSLRLATERIQ